MSWFDRLTMTFAPPGSSAVRILPTHLLQAYRK